MKEAIISRDRVDILKAFAIIAVIFIHVVSVALQFTKPHTANWFSLITFDQILRFCVPVFIALSGFGLSAKYKDQGLDLKDFYLRRATKILPQYLFWSIVIYFSLMLLHTITGEVIRFNFFQAIIFGSADYHLYFVPLIFQFYILFPLLFWITRKNSWLAFFIAAAIQICIFLLIGEKTEIKGYNEKWSDQRQYIFFGSWLTYFILGMVLGLGKITILKGKKLLVLLFTSLMAGIAGLYWCIDNSMTLAKAGIDLQAVTRFTRLPVLVYSTGLIIFTLLIYNPVTSLGFLRKTFLQIGRNSYTTYLLHTLVLRLFILLLPALLTQNVYLFGFLVLTISIVSSQIFNKALKYGQNLFR